MRILIAACLLTSSLASANAYVIHATNGEFVNSSDPCGVGAREAITSVVVKTPTVTIHDEQMWLSVDIVRAATETYVDGKTSIGIFRRDESTTFVITITAGVRPSASISFIRRDGDARCFEKWSGSLEVRR